MKKIILLLLLTGAGILPLSAQTNNPIRFEVEADPIAYALQGYSFHGILVINRLRIDGGIFGIAQPEGYSGNDGFHTYSSGYGLKVNYLLNKKETLFAGIGTGYSQNSIQHNETSAKATQQVFSIGVHAGYRWFMFRQSSKAWHNLYLAPWCSIDYNTTSSEPAINNLTYHQKEFSIFPTIHIGYKL